MLFGAVSLKTAEDVGSNPAGGIFYEVNNEKKFKTLEKERTNALEMAKEAHEERKETQKE